MKIDGYSKHTHTHLLTYTDTRLHTHPPTHTHARTHARTHTHTHTHTHTIMAVSTTITYLHRCACCRTLSVRRSPCTGSGPDFRSHCPRTVVTLTSDRCHRWRCRRSTHPTSPSYYLPRQKGQGHKGQGHRKNGLILIGIPRHCRTLQVG